MQLSTSMIPKHKERLVYKQMVNGTDVVEQHRTALSKGVCLCVCKYLPELNPDVAGTHLPIGPTAYRNLVTRPTHTY